RFEQVRVGPDADDHPPAAANPFGNRLPFVFVGRCGERLPEAPVGSGADHHQVHARIADPLVGHQADVNDLRRLHPAAAELAAGLVLIRVVFAFVPAGGRRQPQPAEGVADAADDIGRPLDTAEGPLGGLAVSAAGFDSFHPDRHGRIGVPGLEVWQPAQLVTGQLVALDLEDASQVYDAFRDRVVGVAGL